MEVNTEAGIEAGIKAGAALQASSAEQQPAKACQAEVTDKPAQMTHKPLVFDIEDSCDDAVCEGDQAQPAFIIDIDDFADEPPAQMTCDVAPAAPSSAQAASTVPGTSSPNPHASAQPPSAAPSHSQRQAALSVAGITPRSTADKAPTAYAVACVAREQQQATQDAHKPPGLSSPCMGPCPVWSVSTDAMRKLPLDSLGRVPTDALGPVLINPMGTVPIDAMGPVPTDAMTVPDTPPYSHASHVGSPTGPTWLSPMLTKQQPGQGKQYSPSMLGRPAGMPHMDASLTHTASVAAAQVLPPSHVSPFAAHAQQPLLSLPERQRVRAVAPAAACAGAVQPQGELGPYKHPHRQSQAASQLPGSVQAAVPAAVVDEGRSSGRGTAAAATGVFADWNRQKANQSRTGAPDAAMPQSDTGQLQDRLQSQQQWQQLSSTATLAAHDSQPSAKAEGPHRQPRWASLPQRHAEEDSAAAKHLSKKAAAGNAKLDASESAQVNKKPCRAEEAPHQAKAASSIHIHHKVLNAAPSTNNTQTFQIVFWSNFTQLSSLQAPVVPSDDKVSAGKKLAVCVVAAAASDQAAAAAATAASEENYVVSQRAADTTDCAASYTADDWDWQQSQSQANLGFQDAFGASQGLGGTPDLTPAVTWAAPKPAAQQSQAREKPSTAKHVPFSTRRIALPTSKPEMKQRLAATVQQPNPEFLSVRRPLPKQQPALSSQGVAPVKASSPSNGAGAGPDAKLLRDWSQGAASASRKLRHPLPAHAQAMSVRASRPVPSGFDSSLRHDTTAAATEPDGISSGTATNVTRGTGPGVAEQLRSGVHTLNTAGLQPQRAHTQVARVNSGHDCTTAAASRQTVPLSNKSPAAAAMSPAAAIFGPHIAGPVYSQSHAKKKLCLRLAPKLPDPAAAASSTAPLAAWPHQAGRQAQGQQQPLAQHGLGAAAAGSTAAAVDVVASPHQAGKNPHGQLQPPAQRSCDGAAAAATAEVDLAHRSSTHQQSRVGKGQLDRTAECGCDGRVKGPRNGEAACREAEEPVAAAAVLSPVGEGLVVASPEAATPAGKQPPATHPFPLSYPSPPSPPLPIRPLPPTPPTHSLTFPPAHPLPTFIPDLLHPFPQYLDFSSS